MNIVKGWLQKQDEYFPWNELPKGIQSMIVDYAVCDTPTACNMRLVNQCMLKILDSKINMADFNIDTKRLFQFYSHGKFASRSNAAKNIRRLYLSQDGTLYKFMEHIKNVYLNYNMNSPVMETLWNEDVGYFKLIFEHTYTDKSLIHPFYGSFFEEFLFFIPTLQTYNIPADIQNEIVIQKKITTTEIKKRLFIGCGIPISKYTWIKHELSVILTSINLTRREWLHIISIGDEETINFILTVYNDRMPDKLQELLAWSKEPAQKRARIK